MHMRNAITMLGLVSAMSLSACGGDKGDDLGRFVGTWSATSGNYNVVCPGYAPDTYPVSGNVVWNTGVSSDLVVTDTGGCAITADVRGSTASGDPGKSCTSPDGVGGLQTITLASYTFVIAPDGRTATENASGNITDVAAGVSIVCTFNENASYQKIGN